eukprot:scaffold1077_cov178-Ochromonas_danica.AAC.3
MTGRTILITGASRGIGLGLVGQILASHPRDRVIATYRDQASSPKLVELTQTYPKDRLLILPLEVTSEESHKKLKEALEAEGINSIDILIANAGVASSNFGSPVSTTAAEYESDWKVNVLGTLYTLQTFHEHVLRSKVKLTVVVSSIMASLTLLPEMGSATLASAYRVSKTALNMLAATFAEDANYKGAGGKVVILHPGWVQTDMGGARAPTTVSESVTGIVQVLDQATEVQVASEVEGRGDYQKKLKEGSHVFVDFQVFVLSSYCGCLCYDGFGDEFCLAAVEFWELGVAGKYQRLFLSGAVTPAVVIVHCTSNKN